jgi:hypothetical protein
MKMRGMILLTLLGALAGFGSPARGQAQPGDLKLQVGKDTVQALLNASLPFTTEVGASLLKESLTFSQPQNLSLGDGKITFALHCQGSPFPIDQILHPVFSFRPGAQGYQLVAESLPLSVTGFGRIDLKDLFPPVDLQGLLRQELTLSGRPSLMEIRVEHVEVTKGIIDCSARLLLSAPTAH